MISFRAFFSKVVNKYRHEGFRGFVLAGSRLAYNFIRPYLPPGEYPTCSGVKIGSQDLRSKPLDQFLGINTWLDTHKQVNVKLIQEYVATGDTVRVVGGGYGITAVIAAQMVREQGKVYIYEGAANQIRTIQRTIYLNNIDNIMDIKHAIVGDAVELKSGADGAERIPPEELPSCDVLEMDCEGSEISILNNMDICPGTIIVETHPNKGAPTSDVKTILREEGYTIIDSEPDRKSGSVLVAQQ